MSSSTSPVVICGAGVIGAAVAYYLTLRGLAVSVIEREHTACAASGKAGGFLALDWCDGTALGPLARRSFALHAELAQTLKSNYGYRRLRTLAVSASAKPAPKSLTNFTAVHWLDGNCLAASILGDEQTTAQVHPELFTQALLAAACQSGAKLIKGVVEGIVQSDAKVIGVRVDGSLLPTNTAVIAMGPWSGQLAGTLPLPSIYGLKGHSIIVRPSVPVPAQALFLDYETAHGERLAPEVYPRPDGTVYLSGLSEDAPVPPQPADVKPHAQAGQYLQTIAASLSSGLAHTPERIQACYRPIVQDGLPLLGEIPGVIGAFIATGHSCWGILNAPASGLALAEMITEGRAHALDLSPFSPARLLV